MQHPGLCGVAAMVRAGLDQLPSWAEVRFDRVGPGGVGRTGRDGPSVRRGSSPAACTERALAMSCSGADGRQLVPLLEDWHILSPRSAEACHLRRPPGSPEEAQVPTLCRRNARQSARAADTGTLRRGPWDGWAEGTPDILLCAAYQLEEITRVCNYYPHHSSPCG